MSRTIIIDNLQENFIKQPENGIKISSFFGAQDDTKLHGLANELKRLVAINPEDVRSYLPTIREQINMEARPKMTNIVVDWSLVCKA